MSPDMMWLWLYLIVAAFSFGGLTGFAVCQMFDEQWTLLGEQKLPDRRTGFVYFPGKPQRKDAGFVVILLLLMLIFSLLWPLSWSAAVWGALSD